MKKNSLNVFERFAKAYFAFVNSDDQRYLIRINGVVVSQVITSKDELREALEGALAVNPKSDVEVYMIADIDLFEDEEVEDEVIEETEEATEETEADAEEVSDVSEIPEAGNEIDDVDVSKDLPTKTKSISEIGEYDKKVTKKAAKKAKKLAKLAKKAAKAESKLAKEIEPPVHTESYTDEDVANWETPGTALVNEPVKMVVPKVEPVAKTKVVKKTTKKTTTTKTVGATQSVQQIHLDTGAVIATFDSVSHAAKATGVRGTNISKVTNGHRKSTGGFGWKKV